MTHDGPQEPHLLRFSVWNWLSQPFLCSQPASVRPGWQGLPCGLCICSQRTSLPLVSRDSAGSPLLLPRLLLMLSLSCPSGAPPLPSPQLPSCLSPSNPAPHPNHSPSRHVPVLFIA